MNIWLFVKSKEMRSLIDINREISVVKFDEMIKINPFNPCGMNIPKYISLIVDIFIQSQRLYDGTKNYIIEHLKALYTKYQQYGRHPSLFDLYEYIKSLKHPTAGRIAYFRESALNRLGGLLSGPLGSIFDCSEGYEKSLLNYNCIFEIDCLTTEQQVFIVNYLLTNLFYHRLRVDSNEWFLVGIDDANLIFDASYEKRPDLGLPIIHNLLSTVRKSRINIFCCTQAPHQLGASIHSNSAIKIMFSLSNGRDIEFMQKSMGNFDPDQKEYSYGL